MHSLVQMLQMMDVINKVMFFAHMKQLVTHVIIQPAHLLLPLQILVVGLELFGAIPQIIF